MSEHLQFYVYKMFLKSGILKVVSVNSEGKPNQVKNNKTTVR
jgi:hypothetical protein